MKYLFNLVCLILIFASCKDNAPAPVPGGIDLSGFDIKKVNGSNTSYVVKTDDSGNPLQEGMVSDGLQDGTWITYHTDESNKIATISNFVRGVLNGPYLEFNIRGQIEKKSNFINNQIHGLYSEYKFGRPLKEYMYEDGILNGVSREYSDRGELIKETSYKNGELHGSIKQYDAEGNLMLEYVYKNGNKVSGGIVSKE
jgi:antitoxin component YwqK of YwqJK toxin-antitoxin module